MAQTLEADFENRTFVSLVGSADGQPVRPTVETGATPGDVLALAEQVYAGLSDEEIDDVERISLHRHACFGDRMARRNRCLFRRFKRNGGSHCLAELFRDCGKRAIRQPEANPRLGMAGKM